MTSVPSGPWFPWQQRGGGGPRHGRADGSHQRLLPDQPRDCAQRAAATRLRDQAGVPRQLPRGRLSRPDPQRVEPVPEWSRASREYMDAPFHRTFFSVDSCRCRLWVEPTGFCRMLQSPWLPVCSLLRGLSMLCYCVDIYKVFICVWMVFFVLTQQRKSLIFCDVCGETWPTILDRSSKHDSEIKLKCSRVKSWLVWFFFLLLRSIREVLTHMCLAGERLQL